MQRRDFGTWGIELDRARFAHALAALGIVVGTPDVPSEERGPAEPPPDDIISDLSRLPEGERLRQLGEMAEPLKDRLFTLYQDGLGLIGQPPRPLVWDMPRDLAASRFLDFNTAVAFADAWEQALPLMDEPPRIEIRAASWWAGASSPSWLVEQLLLAGARTAWVGLEDATARRVMPRWGWPLRIGFLDDPASQRLRAEFERGLPWPDLAEVVAAGAGAPPLDLLFVPDTLTDGLAALLRRPIRTACVVFLSRLAEPWDRARPLLAALRAQTRASGVAFAQVRAADRAFWLTTVVEMLAHNTGFDVALFDAARMIPSPPPLLFGDRRLIANSELTQVAARIRRQFRRPTAAMAPSLPPLLEAAEIAFDAESGGASDLARAARSVQPVLHVIARPRFIQARLFDQSDPTTPRQIAGALPAETPIRTDVWIGPAVADAVVANVVFPDAELPPDETHRLTVVFTELASGREPQVAEIRLPPGVASDACSFLFNSGPPGQPFAARIAVLHRNRVLQTALLRADVVASGQEGDTAPPTLTVEAVVRARIEDLAWRQPFDAALIVNRTDTGRRLLTTVADQRVDVREPADLDQLTATLKAFLEQVNDDPQAFTDDPDTALGPLLLRLALHGSGLFAELVENQAGSALAAAKRLQVISARAEAYLPLEFVYDRETPALDATLCPNARDALRAGACPPGCLDGIEPESVVCPFGFWSLSKVIERHVHDPDREDAPDEDFAIRCEPSTGRRRLDPTGPALYAASNRVDGVTAGSIAQVLGALVEATDGRAEQVQDWAAWAAAVALQRPTLLVVLPHLVRNDEFKLPALEVSLAEQLLSAEVKRKHVRAGDETFPIVLLLGCETGDPTLPYEKFPAAFRRQGAAIVLATLTKVIGRHAAPIAARLVTALAARAEAEECSFGEVLLSLRRDLLAEGIPTVLTLTAYGDADWLLGVPSTP